MTKVLRTLFLLVQFLCCSGYITLPVSLFAGRSRCLSILSKKTINTESNLIHGRRTKRSPEILEASAKVEQPTAGSSSGGSKPHSIMNQGKPIARDDIVNPNRLKIMGGTMRGRKINSPDVYLRPMMAKVREALFSSLYSLGLYDQEQVRVLDIFAGSGSVGLEALSRGASYATFVDMAPECTTTALRNAAACGFSTRVSATTTNALDALRNPQAHGLSGTYQLITLTPPYEEVSYPELLEAVCNTLLIAPNSFMVIEYPVEMACLEPVLGGDKLFGLRNRRYGRTILAIYVYKPTRSFDLRPEEFVPYVKRSTN